MQVILSVLQDVPEPNLFMEAHGSNIVLAILYPAVADYSSLNNTHCNKLGSFCTQYWSHEGLPGRENVCSKVFNK